jgi:hypothetical protein
LKPTGRLSLPEGFTLCVYRVIRNFEKGNAKRGKILKKKGNTIRREKRKSGKLRQQRDHEE